MRKISVAVGLICSLVLSSCRSTSPAQNQISVCMKDDLRSWDPRESRLLSEMNLLKHIYEGLVQENSITGDLEPALAESFSISEDGKVYTFYLREAYWSNGDRITAEDFVDSWSQVVSQKVTGAYGFAFDVIRKQESPHATQGFYAKDSQTLVIELVSPISHFLKLLALPVFFPVHRSTREMFFQNPVTSGAFYPKEIKQKQWITLSKNPYYYRRDNVRMETIKVYLIPDPNTAALLFKQGKLHWQGPPWGDHIPKETLSHLRASGRLCSFDVAGTSWLIFNTQSLPFSHPKLRQALSLALDKEELVLALFSKPAQHLLPKNLHTYPSKDNLSKEHSKQQAVQLFQEALQELQMTAKQLETESIIFPAHSYSNTLLVQMIREQWKSVLGFTIPVIAKEFSLMQEALSSCNFSLAIGGWIADFSDPMAFLSIFSYPKGLSPYAIDNEVYQKLLRDVETETDPNLRQKLISQAALYLEALQVIEPLYHDVFHFALSKNLSNIGFSPTGLVDFRFASEI